MQLFRPEALRGQDRLHGDVALVQPVSWRAMGLFLLGTLAAAALFLAAARHARVVPAAGVLAGTAGDGRLLQAEIHVPAAAAGFLAPGQPIRISIDALPYQTYGSIEARIDSLSAETVPVALPDGSGTIEAFLVRANLDRDSIEAFGTRRPLRQGMTIRARIATRSRSLAEWLFEPRFAAARR